MALSTITTIAALVIVIIASLALLIYMKFTKTREAYEEAKAPPPPPPVFEYATQKWIHPRKNKFISRFGNYNINTNNMTVTFWVDIKATNGNWRNIFHVTQSSALEQMTSSPAGLPYDNNQDLFRRPAVFIAPNKNTLHICHDTNTSRNNPFDVGLPSNRCHVGLVWNAQHNPFFVTCTCYINDRAVATHTYNDWLAQPDPDALVYMCDRFYAEGGFTIRDFKMFNKSLSAAEYAEVYNNTKAQLSITKAPTGMTNIGIFHPDGRAWKNNGNSLQLNSGNEVRFSIHDSSEVYGNATGRIAFFQGGNRALSVRHSGFVMYTHGFAANNFDFAWYMVRAGDGVLIYNDYSDRSNKGHYVGYDAPTDRILIVPPNDKRIVVWRLDPMPSEEYVN